MYFWISLVALVIWIIGGIPLVIYRLSCRHDEKAAAEQTLLNMRAQGKAEVYLLDERKALRVARKRFWESIAIEGGLFLIGSAVLLFMYANVNQ